MKTLRFILTLLLSVALAAGVMTAIQSCSKDEGPGGGGDTPAGRFTINCRVAQVTRSESTLEMTCTWPHKWESMRFTYFYVDTVPYSRSSAPEVKRYSDWIGAAGDSAVFRPQEMTIFPYTDAGKYVIRHTFEGERKYYVGAYVHKGADTVWSEVFEYTAPVSTEFIARDTIVNITAHSAEVIVNFSIPVNNEMLSVGKYHPCIDLYNANRDTVVTYEFPEFEGRTVSVKLDSLDSNCRYGSTPYLWFEGESYHIDTRTFKTDLPE